MEDKLSRIIDYTEIYLDSKLDFEDIYKKLKALYIEYKLPSNLENHTTENMDELLDDDEFFYYAVPDPKQLRYIIGLYIIDSMWGGYDCEFAYIDIIYNKESLLIALISFGISLRVKEYIGLRSEESKTLIIFEL